MVRHKLLTPPSYLPVPSGTGLVHTAPGHGQEDYQVGTASKWGGMWGMRGMWGNMWPALQKGWMACGTHSVANEL